MLDVDFDIDEDVDTGDGGGINRHEAAMTVVNKEISAERNGGEVVDAASAVGDVAEDEAVRNAGEGGEDVGESKRVHEETFRELKSDALSAGGEDARDAFVNLEDVVGRENGDGGV